MGVYRKDCEECGEAMVMLPNANGGWTPVDADTYTDGEVHVSHFKTCTNPDRFSGSRKR